MNNDPITNRSDYHL